MIVGSIIGSVVGAVWFVRGIIDKFQKAISEQFTKIGEEVKQRHRQNTNRLDFMLRLINTEREESGKDPVPCPFRLIVDP